jgi:polyferredoxin
LPILAAIPRIEDPQQTALQVRQDRRLYVAAVLYFSLILAVLAMEVLNITVISTLMEKVYSLKS